ncbi:LysE family translocator [Sulfitobacter sp. BDSS02]|nr:LysE family translocator [Sulfitobacter sp. BDSS02]MBR9851866.1 LysE family translocator [Paracoccaceae bacterium]
MIAMFVIELTPGPNMGWLAALSAQTGRRAGMIAVLGITIGLSVQVVAAATGLSAIAAASDWLYHLLRWAGVGYMVYLAWCAWAESAEGVPPIRDENAFRRGLISNLLNPKALVFYMVVIGQFTSPQAGPIWLQTLLLGGLHVLTALIVHSAIVLLGAMIGTRLASWQSSVPVRLAFALSLLAIAIWIAISTGTIPNDIVDDAA